MNIFLKETENDLFVKSGLYTYSGFPSASHFHLLAIKIVNVAERAWLVPTLLQTVDKTYYY